MDANRIGTVTVDTEIEKQLGLLEGEQILWSDRPILRWQIRWRFLRGKLFILATLIVPSWMAYDVIKSPGAPPNIENFFFGTASIIWFITAINSLLIKPIVDRWRLRRTRYVLTNRRAFAVAPYLGMTRVQFLFLDALKASFDRVMQADGTGDVTVGMGMIFRHIPRSADVHARLVEAVLAARRDLPDLGWQDLPATQSVAV